MLQCSDVTSAARFFVSTTKSTCVCKFWNSKRAIFFSVLGLVALQLETILCAAYTRMVIQPNFLQDSQGTHEVVLLASGFFSWNLTTWRFQESETALRCFRRNRSPQSSVWTLQFFAANHRLHFTSALWHVTGNRLIESKLDWGFGRKSQRHYNEHVHVAILHPLPHFTNQQGMRQKGEYKEGKCWSSNRGKGRRQGTEELRYDCSGFCWRMRTNTLNTLSCSCVAEARIFLPCSPATTL